MRARSGALFVSSVLLMTAASGARDARLSIADVHDARVIRDVEYGRVNGISLRMDASIPSGAEVCPAIIIVHGGGWVSGDRRWSVEPLFQPLSRAGFAWFSISYRLATDFSHFGSAIDDVQQAIRHVKSHAAEYHIDPERIALVGESAGGQLAAMAAFRAREDASVKAVVAFYAPSDLVSLARNSAYIPSSIRDSVRGTPFEGLVLAALAQLSPINNIRAGVPPMLLIHGTADPLVPFSQSREMCERMQQAKATCEVYPIEGLGHGMRWWESSTKLAAGYKQKLVTWLGQELATTNAVASVSRRAGGS